MKERSYIEIKKEFISRVSAMLGNEAKELLKALDEPASLSVRFNPYKSGKDKGLDIEQEVPWSEDSYYLKERPSFTLDPSFHAGAYYVQEAASMFCLKAIRDTIEPGDEALRILDLCAAPGGKSSLLSQLGKQHLLMSNEVIRSRFQILRENMDKWGTVNRVLSNYDVNQISQLKNFFDIILIDAPCSGEGMFRKDPDSRNEWSEDLVSLCEARQKRILSEAMSCLKPGGLLVYSTCTYNLEENENNVDWLQDTFDLESLEIDCDPQWNISESLLESVKAYRFYPSKSRSEGFFISVLRSREEGSESLPKPKKKSRSTLEEISRKEYKILSDHIEISPNLILFRDGTEQIRMIERHHWNAVIYAKEKLPNVLIGIAIGEIKKKDFVPSHSLAMAYGIELKYPTVDLELKQALRVLKKENIELELDKKGWYLARYNGLNLAWLKQVPGRINNYLPKAYRIRMNIDFDDH